MDKKEGSDENCILPREDVDEVDYPPNKYVYSGCDGFWVIFGALTLVADWGCDIWTACNHRSHNDIGWFTLTVVFICASSLVINGVSLYWYVNADPTVKKDTTKRTWITRCIIIILQLGPLLRYYDTLSYGIKSRRHWRKDEIQQQKRLYTLMLYEDGDSGFLRMFECFIEAAPQLVLQLYTLTQVTEVDDPKYDANWQIFQYVSSLVSLVSLSWGVTAYTRCSRFTNAVKNNISILGTITIFFWHFFYLCARVAALVVFASHFQVYVVYFCLGHWGLVVSYLFTQRMFTPENAHCCTSYEVLMKLFFGIVYIFVFVNIKDEKTRWKYTVYYIVWEVENVVLIVLFRLYADPHTAYYIYAVVFHGVSFALGIVFMVMYYSLLHPTLRAPPTHAQQQQPLQQPKQEQLPQQQQLLPQEPKQEQLPQQQQLLPQEPKQEQLPQQQQQQPQQQPKQQQQEPPSPQSHTNQLRQTEL